MNRTFQDKVLRLENLVSDKLESWASENAVSLQFVEAYLSAPGVNTADKMQIMANTALPLFKDLKNDEDIMSGVVSIAQDAVRDIRDKLQDTGRQEQLIEAIAQAINTGAIKINPRFVGDDETPTVEENEKEFSLLDFSFTIKINPHPVFPEGDELETFLTQSFKALSEDEYIAAGKGLADAYPKHLRELLLEPTDQHLDNILRDNFNALQTGGEIRTPINMFADAMPREMRVLAMGQVISKLSFERGFQSVTDIVNNLDDDMVEDLVRGTVNFTEAMLESAAKTGTLFKIQNGAAVHDFAKAIGRFMQVVEDAVMDADLTPDEDFLSTYREKIAEANARQSVQRHLKP
jgi:hypothetical protein